MKEEYKKFGDSYIENHWWSKSNIIIRDEKTPHFKYPCIIEILMHNSIVGKNMENTKEFFRFNRVMNLYLDFNKVLIFTAFNCE